MKVLTSLTVLSGRIVLTDTSTVNHASLAEDIPPSSVHRCTLAGVSVTEAATSDHHVVKSVVIFVLRVPAFSTQQSVAQREETSEVNTNICQGDQILDVWGIWVLYLKDWIQSFQHHLSVSGRV